MTATPRSRLSIALDWVAMVVVGAFVFGLLLGVVSG